MLDNKHIAEIKGELSFSEIMNNDQSNISNHYNTHRFRQVLEGNIKSPALTYLLNMGHMGISDYKTLDYFNKKMIAVKEMAVGEMSEVKNQRTIFLTGNFRERKIRMTELLNRRKSSREFVRIPLEFKRFCQILHSLCDSDRKQKYLDFTVPTRSYASGGGLYPITAYLLVLNVENVEKGWYKLQPHSHSIQLINELENTADSDIIPGGNIEFKDAEFVIFYGFDLTKSYPKYGETSLQLGLIEVGEMAQLVDITSTSIALGSCQSAGFNKKEVQDALLLDGVTEQILHSQIIGEIK